MNYQKLEVRYGNESIGFITFVGEYYRFYYWPYGEYLSDGTPAEIPGIPRLSSPNKRKSLWAIFAERIPSKKRPDFQKMMEEFKIENPDNKMEILAKINEGTAPNNKYVIVPIPNERTKVY